MSTDTLDTRYQAAVEIREAVAELEKSLDKIALQLQAIAAHLKEMNERQRFQS